MGLWSTSWILWNRLEYPQGEEPWENIFKVEAKVGKGVWTAGHSGLVVSTAFAPRCRVHSAVHLKGPCHSRLAALTKLMPCSSLQSCYHVILCYNQIPLVPPPAMMTGKILWKSPPAPKTRRFNTDELEFRVRKCCSCHKGLEMAHL